MMWMLASLRDHRGAAAAEMALVLPLLLTLFIGLVELGHYFYNEHILVKAVRDGARFAARHNFNYYGTSSTCADPTDATLLSDTKALVRTSLLSGGSDKLRAIQVNDISITTVCYASSGGQSMYGIYRGRTIGAPVVRVTASINYAPIIGAPFGFSGAGFKLNATQEAAVMGI